MHHFRFSQRTVAAVLGVLAVAYTVQAYLIPDFTAVEVPVQPGTLPRGLGLVLIVLCAALFFQRPAAHPADEAPGEAPEQAPATRTADGPATADPSAAADAPAGTALPGQAPAVPPPAPTAGPSPAAPKAAGPALGRLSDTRLDLAVLLGATCLYVALFVPLGFVLATTLFVAGTAWYLGSGRHWVNVLVGGGMALGLYLGMAEGLDVALPTGPLPF
ncbi:tripartite tricarboxylate transporter TctB family protein [Streptomyces sp. 549]|uniref:tripartite tricarboxylate transporter TctB family protein n=1 Tax=Streptomyces sp. 549 TaxID=3049076 RepID=UPI0024C3666E|nr:tripartite tricarboxylate transporter TctB family protein [Streptomyces sp. 549]MDK1476792.1 tripartite tricarboxylate transporter TctB family protein [Streptomyces sp. 549]